MLNIQKVLSRKSVLIELVHDNHWHILSIRVFVTMSTDNLISDNFCLSALCTYLSGNITKISFIIIIEYKNHLNIKIDYNSNTN